MALLDSLASLARVERLSSNISDGVMQLDCLGCLRSLLSRRDGLEMFLNAQHHVDKLVECRYPMFHVDSLCVSLSLLQRDAMYSADYRMSSVCPSFTLRCCVENVSSLSFHPSSSIPLSL